MIPESFRAILARLERPRESKIQEAELLLAELSLGNDDEAAIYDFLDLLLDNLHDHNDEIAHYKKYLKAAIHRDCMPCWDYQPDECTMARWKAEKKEQL